MYCQDPKIILRKDLHKILNRIGRKMVFCDGSDIRSLPPGSKLPSPKLVGANNDNYKNWNVLTEDGILIPIFQQVPCGHCVLCRDKKAKEWSTRASCESKSATYPPVFITLTYADEFLPGDGVNKKHLQNFIKRFRENWCRMYNVDRLDLRYFAVSEYGSKYGRPHYHLLLWNVPNDMCNESPMMSKIRDCVSKSWSEPINESDYNRLLTMHQLHYNGRFYKKYGRTEVTCDRGHSSEYCMKYMHKPKDVPLRWSQPTFYLSSRRGGGIGMRYLNDIIDSIRSQEPAKTTILIQGAAHSYSLPRAFKDKLFPSLSMIIPTHIRCQLCRFDQCFKVLECNGSINDHFEMFKNMRESLRNHYGKSYDYIVQSENMYHSSYDLILTKRMRNVDLYQSMYISFSQCYQWQPDVRRLNYFIELKEKRNEILQKMKHLEFDVDYCIYQVNKRLILNKLKESF